MAYDQHKDRLLALAEAAVTVRELAHLTAVADHDVRGCDLPNLPGIALTHALTELHEDAATRFTFGKANSDDADAFIRQALPAARDRLDTIADRLAAALGAVKVLQGILADLPEGERRDLGREILDAAANMGTEHALTATELHHLWQATAPSEDDRITLETSVTLRRMFDTEIIGATDPDVDVLERQTLHGPSITNTVKRWRTWYLAEAADWTRYDTWKYAATRTGDYDELARLWDRLGGNDHPLTGPERVRVRDAIAAHIWSRSTTPAHYNDPAYQLWKRVNDYDTGGTALSMRVRLAEDAPTLARPFAILRRKWNRTGDGVAMLVAAARKADKLVGVYRDGEEYNDESEAAHELRVAVSTWRYDLFNLAADHAANVAHPEDGEDVPKRVRSADGEHWITYTPEYLSSILYYAMQSSVDHHDHERVDHLSRLAEAVHNRGRLTDDKYAIVQSIAAKLATDDEDGTGQ